MKRANQIFNGFRSHKSFPDEDSFRSRISRPFGIFAIPNAALRNGQSARRDFGNEFFGKTKLRLEYSQIAIVDANDLGVLSYRPFEFCFAMNFV